MSSPSSNKSITNYDDDGDDTIPVIDLSGPDESIVAKELVNAFRTIGFATLIHHGVDPTVISKGFAASRSFFQLPVEVKRRYKYVSHTANRGYIELGSEQHETAIAPDQKETFDIGKEDTAPSSIGDTSETPWPSELAEQGFKEDLLQYFQDFDALNLRLMKLLAIGLNLPDTNFFVDRCNQQHCNLRLLHYPELRKKPHEEGGSERAAEITQRGAKHTDYGTITLLAQDLVGGLRVQRLDGSWTAVKPVQGSIIVNVGEMLQRVSNDVLVATPHQVVDLPSHQEVIPERYSIAFFCNANKDVTLRAPDSLLTNTTYVDDGSDKPSKKKYADVNALEYLTQRLSNTISK